MNRPPDARATRRAAAAMAASPSPAIPSPRTRSGARSSTRGRTRSRRSGLPVARQVDSSGRIRMAFAAPLPAAARGEREWADLWLLERVPAWHVRETLEPRLPAAHAWVDAEDVWLGAPALAGHVAAADWRIEVEPVDATALDALTRAAIALASARAIPARPHEGHRAEGLRPPTAARRGRRSRRAAIGSSSWRGRGSTPSSDPVDPRRWSPRSRMPPACRSRSPR